MLKDDNGRPNQGFIVAEQEVLFEVTGFTIIDRTISLLAAYYSLYISYPKSTMAADELLFIQEVLLETEADKTKRKRVKYNSLISAIVD